MKILRIIEENDKCSRMECEFSHEEVEILMSYAVTNILKEQIKRQEVECEQPEDVGC